MTSDRTATIKRETSESSIELSINLDGTGTSSIETSVPFYDHMLTAFSKHSLIDLTVKANGDTHIDVHHTVEDIGIALGLAIKQALGSKAGISRYGDALVPLDEALVRAVVDVSGRPYLVHTGEPAGFEMHLIGGHSACLRRIAGWVVGAPGPARPGPGWGDAAMRAPRAKRVLLVGRLGRDLARHVR